MTQQKIAFVLAAGKGERMMPLTKNTPKPLLKISNVPMMEYTIRLLKAHGFKKIGVNLFHLGKQIQDHFKSGNKKGVNIIYIQEKYLSGSAGGVRKIFNKVKPGKPFLVVASDMMINFDLTNIYNSHLKNKALVTICCYKRSQKNLVVSKSGLILFDKKSKRITNFIERPNASQIISNWVNSSVYIFDPEMISYIPIKINGSKVIDLAKDVFPKLLHLDKPLYAYPVNPKKFYQLGIDTPERIKKVEEDIKKGKFKPT